MKTILIRRAVPEDSAAVLSIIKIAMEKYAKDSGIPGSLDSLNEKEEDIRRHIKDNCVLIATHLGEAVGTVRISPLSEATAEISRFAVLPSAQQIGVGGKMYRVAEQYILSAGFTSISLHTALSNPATVKFYVSKGFELKETYYDRGYPRGTFVKLLETIS